MVVVLLVICRRTTCSKPALPHQCRYPWLTVSTNLVSHCYSWTGPACKDIVLSKGTIVHSCKQVSRRSSIVPSTSDIFVILWYIYDAVDILQQTNVHTHRERPTDHPRFELWYTIYPLLQCQSSSGSVGKSIWLEFRGPRFESWLDLIVFFSHQITLQIKHH